MVQEHGTGCPAGSEEESRGAYGEGPHGDQAASLVLHDVCFDTADIS